MFRRISLWSSALLVAAVLLNIGGALAQEETPTGGVTAAAALGTAFTYQGSLMDGSNAADGAYDFEFKLFDDVSAGSQVGSTLQKNDVAVSGGLFSVELDFGSAAFNGNTRYLAIGVRPGTSTGAFTTLAPRQSITAAPYALYSKSADTLDGQHASGFLSAGGGAVNGNLDVNGTITGLYGGGVVHGGSAVNKRFLVGTIPYNTSNTNQKLLVTVWGGTWENNTLGQDFYSISSRAGLKITRTRLFGSTSDYGLKIYDNGASYDVVVEVMGQSYPNLAIRSQMLGSTLNGFEELAVTEGYSVTGKTDVTPAFDNQIMVNNAGNVGIGVASPAARLDIGGTARTQVLQITGGSDLAEPFEIAGNVQPGLAVAIDPDHPGQLQIADKAYDQRVAGCVSGANGINPGLVMEQEGSSAAGSFPVALSGRVYCWADASYGPIQPGDLLTTSDTPGHLMIVGDYDQAQGSIVGKAMSGLKNGTGLILVLISLQ